ncbi:MAG: efflux transporter protein [Hyphomicrobiales bacterium]|nr:efflux transporter protein [Hyphomicrobiales bacterium]
MGKVRSLACLCVVLMTGLGIDRVHAQTQNQADVEKFYRGKTLTFIIGTATGAAYDLVGRAVAAHMTRHIPGEPAIVVQNVPGAGSLNMMNALYMRAARDGTVFGLPLNGVLLEQRLRIYSGSGGNVSFDLNKMSWIGSPSRQPQVMWVWHKTPIQSFADLQKGPEAILGATSPTADNYLTPLMAQRLLGAKIKLVTGYQAVNDIFVAAERGEVQGNSTPFSSIMVGKRDEFQAGHIRVVLQFGSDRLKELPNVPTAIELAGNERDKDLFRIWALKFNAAYPIGLPPEVPKARIDALREAFNATMRDGQFLELARRIGLDITPMSGTEIEKSLGDLDKIDEAHIRELREILAP